MSYRGRGGYRGDLSFDDLGSPDLSGMGFDSGTGADIGLPDLGGGGGYSIMPATDTGSSIWQDIGGFLGGAASLPGLTGLGAAGSVLSGVKGLLGGGSAGPGVGSGGTSSKGVKAAVKRALRVATGGRSYRRMNPGNFRALHRSMRRLTAFEHAARRVYKFTHPRPGKSGFKFRRRRRRKC